MQRCFDGKDVFIYENNPDIVLKVIPQSNLHEIEFQNTAAELGHAPPIYKVDKINDMFHITMKRIHGTCLADISEISPEIWNCIRYIIDELYEYGIEYVDINPFNFILDENQRLWIIDFGHAKQTIEGSKDWFIEEFLDGTNGWNPDFI
jgi:tRNA A-37 threonylcarbamoyl transferase component Bud32